MVTQPDLSKENGFTLIEVLISFVIISIILISFFQLFIFSNQLSNRNQDKLVAINLAKSTMERMIIDPDSFIEPPAANPPPAYVNGQKFYSSSSCTDSDCERLFQPLINNKKYSVIVRASQDSKEKTLKLINVFVTVELPDTNIKSSVEGYISYD